MSYYHPEVKAVIALKNSGRLRLLAMALVFASAAPALADGPFQFFPVTPCRVADTRNAVGVNGGPAITVNTTRTFRVQGNCGVPVGAKAVTLNVTVVQPGEAGWLGLYPAATSFSGTSTINFNTGEFAIANGAIVPLSATTNDISVLWGDYSTNRTVTTNVILDVTGYFQ
jgi:hypothetical protein